MPTVLEIVEGLELDDSLQLSHREFRHVGSLESTTVALSLLCQQLESSQHDNVSVQPRDDTHRASVLRVAEFLVRLLGSGSVSTPSTPVETEVAKGADVSNHAQVSAFRKDFLTALAPIGSAPSASVPLHQLEAVALRLMRLLLSRYQPEGELLAAINAARKPKDRRSEPTNGNVWGVATEFFAARIEARLEVGVPAEVVVQSLSVLSLCCQRCLESAASDSDAHIATACDVVSRAASMYSIKHVSVIRALVRFLLHYAASDVASSLLQVCSGEASAGLLVAETEACRQATFGEILSRLEGIVEAQQAALPGLRRFRDGEHAHEATILQPICELVGDLERVLARLDEMALGRFHNRILALLDRVFAFGAMWCKHAATDTKAPDSVTPTTNTSAPPTLQAKDSTPPELQQVGGPRASQSTQAGAQPLEQKEQEEERSALAEVHSESASVLRPSAQAVMALLDLSIRAAEWLRRERSRLSASGCKRVPALLSKIERFHLALRRSLAGSIGAEQQQQQQAFASEGTFPSLATVASAVADGLWWQSRASYNCSQRVRPRCRPQRPSQPMFRTLARAVAKPRRDCAAGMPLSMRHSKRRVNATIATPTSRTGSWYRRVEDTCKQAPL